MTRDRYPAQELRQMVRTFCGENPSLTQGLQGTLVLVARIIAHWGPVYGFPRKILSSTRIPRPRNIVEPYPASWSLPGTEGKEWRRLPSGPELRMITHNVSNFKKHAAHRRELDRQYRSSLRSLTGALLPPLSIGVLSHFTIRVAASKRELIRRKLWAQGIDTGDIFGYPHYCDPNGFPNAFKATEEIINLPMERGITAKHVLIIASMLESFECLP